MSARPSPPRHTYYDPIHPSPETESGVDGSDANHHQRVKRKYTKRKHKDDPPRKSSKYRSGVSDRVQTGPVPLRPAPIPIQPAPPRNYNKATPATAKPTAAVNTTTAKPTAAKPTTALPPHRLQSLPQPVYPPMYSYRDPQSGVPMLMHAVPPNYIQMAPVRPMAPVGPMAPDAPVVLLPPGYQNAGWPMPYPPRRLSSAPAPAPAPDYNRSLQSHIWAGPKSVSVDGSDSRSRSHSQGSTASLYGAKPPVEETPKPAPEKQRSKRSRKGCLTCRSRKRKCDEVKPICSECNRLGLKCVWAKSDREGRNKSRHDPHALRIDEVYNEEFGVIKVVRGKVDYKVEESKSGEASNDDSD